ncbi:MAG TPA: sigma-70 family RNA polymerase sigma factor [Solirubrobacteraceae bacterium]|jgi:RNA polymerase sigma-70 factor (ECF subfamily)
MDLRDPSTFSRVYARHAPEVEAIAHRVLGDRAQAQDVAHDVFLRLWMRPSRFDAGRGDVGAYLRMLARSRALDAQRSLRAASRAGDRYRDACVRAEPAVAHGPARTSEHREDRRELVRALRALPDPQREAVVLAYWADLPDHQIARRAGVPLGTAKSRVRLGLKRLRAEYGVAAAA